MTPDEVKEFYRSQYNFKKETGMSHRTLGNWLKWGYVPRDAQYKLETITGGKLKMRTEDMPKSPRLKLTITRKIIQRGQLKFEKVYTDKEFTSLEAAKEFVDKEFPYAQFIFISENGDPNTKVLLTRRNEEWLGTGV